MNRRTPKVIKREARKAAAVEPKSVKMSGSEILALVEEMERIHKSHTAAFDKALERMRELARASGN